MFQYAPSMPDTEDGIEAYLYHVFSYAYIRMLEFNLWLGTISINNNK